MHLQAFEAVARRHAYRGHRAGPLGLQQESRPLFGPCI